MQFTLNSYPCQEWGVRWTMMSCFCFRDSFTLWTTMTTMRLNLLPDKWGEWITIFLCPSCLPAERNLVRCNKRNHLCSLGFQLLAQWFLYHVKSTCLLSLSIIWLDFFFSLEILCWQVPSICMSLAFLGLILTHVERSMVLTSCRAV